MVATSHPQRWRLFYKISARGLGKSWFHKRACWQDEKFAASTLCFCSREQVSKEFLSAYTLLGLWKKNHKTAEEKLLCHRIQGSKDSRMSSKDTYKKKAGKSFQAHTRAAKTRGWSIFFCIIFISPNIDCHQEVLTSLKFCSKFRRCRHCSSFCWCLIQNSSKAVSVSCNWARSL